MKYAVVKIGGSQYKVSEGEMITVDRLSGKEGSSIVFSEVLLLVDDDKVKIGRPLVKDGQVKGEIVSQTKGKKIRVATFKAKARYRRVRGFRSLLTRVKILSIIAVSN